jgi:WD40 repeat protein
MTAIEFSLDEEIIATGSDGGRVDLWEPATGAHRCKLVGSGGEVTVLAFSARGDLLAAATTDAHINVWRRSEGELYCTLTGHVQPIRNLSFPSADDELIASVSDDLTICLMHMPTNSTVEMHPHVAFPGLIANDSDGNGILARYCGNLRHTLADCVLAGVDSWKPQHASIVGEWLVWGSERLLWLPPLYRPSSLALCGNLVVLACQSGQAAVIGLDAGRIRRLLSV